ncbi:MAG TPA: hypothetical protein VMR70_06985, partial [Flavisolibacter sp.]|nr:hypothetical protein [Flavisolibacter sp.]
MKTILLLAAIFIGSIRTLSAQCIEAPAYTPLTGTEPLVTAGETLLPSQTKYFYGGPVTLNNIHLRGGKLIVSGQITLDNFGFETGELVVLPGGSVVVNNPTGLVLRGNCAIYNWGNFQCLGNIVLDYGTTSATRPNLIINASASANFRMPNQYFLINNPWSKFVNMGTAEFHGIITDPGAAAGSVCLGDTSVTTMRVLYNNAKNTYAVPSGSACL